MDFEKVSELFDLQEITLSEVSHTVEKVRIRIYVFILFFFFLERYSAQSTYCGSEQCHPKRNECP